MFLTSREFPLRRDEILSLGKESTWGLYSIALRCIGCLLVLFLRMSGIKRADVARIAALYALWNILSRSIWFDSDMRFATFASFLPECSPCSLARGPWPCLLTYCNSAGADSIK